MGTLNEVYQLKPIALSASAILKVKKNCEDSFMKQFDFREFGEEVKGLFSDMFVCKSNDGNVERLAIYSPNRTINFKESGIYLSIQSNGKWGFCDAFEKGIEDIAPFLEDSLFFIIYDVRISRYEVLSGKLRIEVTNDFDKWDYRFDQYVLSNYQESPQVIADFYVDQIVEMKLHYDEMIKDDEDPGRCYEEEEYEELLIKIRACKKNIPNQEMKNLENWLEERIIQQKAWDDQYYD